MTKTTLTRQAAPQYRLARTSMLPAPSYRAAPSRSIPMDAERDDQAVRLTFDLPGLTSQDVDVTVEKQVLTVTAEVPERDSDATVIAAERKSGTLRRQLVLGDELDGSTVEAAMNNGVLTLKIAVAEQAKPFSVAIADVPSAETSIEAGVSEDN